MSWIYTLASVMIVSMISLVGALTLSVQSEKLKQWLMYLVSFSAGALLGDVFLHIFPEISEKGFGRPEGLYLLIGLFIFIALEKLIGWHHSHSEHKEEVHSMVYLTQAGDTLHNFIDGMIIAASFLISVPLGMATSLAVIFHEIPQEIGNFAILVHGGWSTKKALFYNFISALSAVFGALLVLLFVKNQSVPVWLIAMAASSFIYIALSDLVPEIQKENDKKRSFFLLVWFVLGVVAMAGLLFLE